MKPGKPLGRRTRLKAKTRLERRTPFRSGGSKLQHGKPIAQQSTKKRAKRRTWEQLRIAVLERNEGCCDLCGLAIAREDYECHHRRLRAQGGLDEMPNLVALHKFPCHAHVHDNRAWAQEKGWIVHHPDDPAEAPVMRAVHGWGLPGETWTAVDPEELAA